MISEANSQLATGRKMFGEIFPYFGGSLENWKISSFICLPNIKNKEEITGLGIEIEKGDKFILTKNELSSGELHTILNLQEEEELEQTEEFYNIAALMLASQFVSFDTQVYNYQVVRYFCIICAF